MKTEDNSLKNVAIQLKRMPLWYSKNRERMDNPTCYGIETDKGVLLFDNSVKGRNLMQDYKYFFIGNFFDNRLDITFLKTLELVPDEEQMAKINPNIYILSSQESFGKLSDSDYTDIKDISIVQEIKQYDMSATIENFVDLAGLNDRMILLPPDTNDIRGLLWLSNPECKSPEIQDFPNSFSYHHKFRPLAERFVNAPTEQDREAIMKVTRVSAQQILKEDFPNIRKPNPVLAEKQEIVYEKSKKEDMIKKKTVPRKVSAPPPKRLTPLKKKGGLKM